ncbi:unnamed protein product [Ascophyllum nodosum]
MGMEPRRLHMETSVEEEKEDTKDSISKAEEPKPAVTAEMDNGCIDIDIDIGGAEALEEVLEVEEELQAEKDCRREARQERESFDFVRNLLFPHGCDQDEDGVENSDDWNERFQKALYLPEETDDDCYLKWQRLTTVNRDFVATAVTYGKTIISEYFLKDSDKSIQPRMVGGQAGGKKFLWRGILFKLADGSTGPYCGNDEAAAKGAGHDLKGATRYLGTRIKTLHYALQCLIDYLGFRMTAQAELPVDSSTLRYGTADAARTVHNDDAELERKLEATAKKLNLRTHLVHGVRMHSACDVEGHKGKDGRHYLLDFARSFPPESPFKVDHLSQILNNGTPVHVNVRSFLSRSDPDVVRVWEHEEVHERMPGTITKAHVPLDDASTLLEANIKYTVRFSCGQVCKVPAVYVKDRHLCIYWRMLRPEFVRSFSGTKEEETLEDTKAPQQQQEQQGQQEQQQLPKPPRIPGAPSAPKRHQILPATGFQPTLHYRISEASNEDDWSSIVSVNVDRDSSPRQSVLSPALAPTTEEFETRGAYTGNFSDSDGGVTSMDQPSPPLPQETENEAAAAEAKPRKDSIEQEEEEKGHYLSDRTSMATSTSSHFTATAEEDTNASTWGSQKGMVNQSSPTSLTAPGGSTVRALSPSLHVYGSAPGIPGKIIREKRFRMFHSSDGEGPSGCGGCGARYEVFSKFDKMSQREKDLLMSSLTSSKRLLSSFNNTPRRSIKMSTSIRVPRGDGSTMLQGAGGSWILLGTGGGYEVLEPTGPLSRSLELGNIRGFLSRRDLSVGSGNVGGGAGGASGRAGPRTIFVEGTGSSGNSLSYRFYPEREDVHGGDARNIYGKRSPQGGWRAEGNESETAGEVREFIPLSPDALSGFSRGDPEVSFRNQEVHDATGVLIEEVIPNLADQLQGMALYDQETLDVAIEMHRHGVNIRHLGKLRNEVEETFLLLKEMILTEMVARTLKNLLRGYQRRWMKTERSTSDQGMRRLVVNFLNLVTGAHQNAGKFWKFEVTVGLLQRFGVCALSPIERNDLESVCTENPLVLKACVGRLVEMQGLVLIPTAEKLFETDNDPKGFEFVVADIQEIRPIVRYMHILDYGGGVMLSMQAKKRGQDHRIAKRLNWQAMQHFRTAYQSMPGDEATRTALLSYSTSRGFPGNDPPPPPQDRLPERQPLVAPPRDSPEVEPVPIRPVDSPDGIWPAPPSIAKRVCTCIHGISVAKLGAMICCRRGRTEGTEEELFSLRATSSTIRGSLSRPQEINHPRRRRPSIVSEISNDSVGPTPSEDLGAAPDHLPGHMPLAPAVASHQGF